MENGPASPINILCQRGCEVNAPGSSAACSSPGSFAGHFDVAAQRQQADFVVGIAVFDAEQAGTEANGKRFDADTAELGNGKMSEFMDHHHESEEDDKGDGRN